MAFSDDFQLYTSGADLADQANWSCWTFSGSGVMRIDTHPAHKSGQVVDMSEIGTQYAIWQSDTVGSDDQYVEVVSFPDVGSVTGGSENNGLGCGSGPLLRMQASSPNSPSGYMVEWRREAIDMPTASFGSFLVLYRVDSGVKTQLAKTSNLDGIYTDLSLPRTILAEVEGSTITAYVDGNQELSYDTTGDGTSYATGQYVGVYQTREFATVSYQPFFDDFEAGIAGTGPNSPPTVDAGADQLVNAYQTVTLTAVASDPDSDPVNVTWEQTGGFPTVVTLSGTGDTRTFTAPALRDGGADLTFTATASDGILDATDDIVVTVQPHNEWAVMGSAEVPIRVSTVSGGAGDATWQEAVDSAVAADAWTPITDWYAANTGHEAIGYAVGDLTSGDIDSEYDGQVFEGISAGRIRVGHNNVTIRGCRVTDGATYGVYLSPTFGANVTGLLIEHCTFVRETVDPPSDGSNIAYIHPALGGTPGAGYDVTVRYCNAYGWSGGIKAFNRVLLEYNYIHDMQHPDGVHMNCARPMGQGAKLYRNCGTDGRSGTFSIYFDKEVTSDITLEQNIAAGVSPLAAPSYHHAIKSGAYGPTATNIKILGTMFGPGQYGPGSGGDVPWGTNGNVRSGNHVPIDSWFFGGDRDVIEGDETFYPAGTYVYND